MSQQRAQGEDGEPIACKILGFTEGVVLTMSAVKGRLVIVERRAPSFTPSEVSVKDERSALLGVGERDVHHGDVEQEHEQGPEVDPESGSDDYGPSLLPIGSSKCGMLRLLVIEVMYCDRVPMGRMEPPCGPNPRRIATDRPHRLRALPPISR